MQHHQQLPPRPQHMRAHHMHQQTVPPKMHAAAALPPPPHMTMNLGPPQQQNPPLSHQQQQKQQQQQQPQTHHMSNGPALVQQQQQQQPKSNYLPPQQQHMREQHNRLSHHHQQQQQQHHHHHLIQTQQQQIQRINPQTILTTTQMQKIRQQHQLVNNNNGSVNSSSNQHQQQQQPHMGVQQHQQRNIHHSTQHHVPHIKPHQQQQPQHHAPNTIPPPISILKQQQSSQQQILPKSTASVVVQQQHCYPGGNKHKYNNSSATVAAAADVVPKVILQNPNRSIKNRPQNYVVVSPTELATVGVAPQPNNVLISEAATPIVSAKLVTTATILQEITTSVAPTLLESEKDTNAESNKDSTASTILNDCDELPGDNVISCGDSISGNSSKEKTPMCLVNELARFNKITHQYRLTSEKGPAHCKRFTVTLKLGDEEYSAEGYKIKKAQHLAAAEAIEKTKYKHPVPKIIRRSEDGNSRATITPTVELNALAMKLGQQTYYLFDPRQQPPPDAGMPPPPPPDHMMYAGMPPPPHGPATHGGPHMIVPPPSHHHHMMDAANSYMWRNASGPYATQRFGHRGGYSPHPSKYNAHQRYPLIPPAMGGGGGPPHHPGHTPYPPPLTTPCKITLIVGKQKFVGTGRTLQAAKHDAASRALQVLKTQATNKLNEILNRSIEDSDSKSPISLVHEIGIKRSLTVHFKVLREEGPAHMKNFITACIVGQIVTEGEGNGKKISKKRAAEKMLDELKKLPPLSPTKSPVKRIKVRTAPARAVSNSAGATAAVSCRNGSVGANERIKKRPGGASIKEKSEADIADSDNPISKLIVLVQGRKEKEPVYELITKTGSENTRRREFIMEVSAMGMVERGTGSNKKIAKRNAAQNLFNALCGEDIIDALPVAITSHGEDKQQQPDVEIVENNNCMLNADANDVSKNAAAVIPVTEVEPLAVPLVKTTAGQVPGILILRQNKKNAATKNVKNTVVIPPSTTSTLNASDKITASASAPAPVATAAPTPVVPATPNITETAPPDAKNNNSNVSETTSVLNTSTSSNTSSGSTDLRMKNQLLYLAQLLGFEVDFNDYPKGNHNEYLTIVTLSTTPPQICHGTGANSEESQNDAAKNALKIISKLGLNNVKSN